MKERLIQTGIAVTVAGLMLGVLWLIPQRGPTPEPVPIPPLPVPTKERPLVLPVEVKVQAGGEKIEAMIFDGAKVTWIVPPASKVGLSVFPYADHAIVVPRAEGEFDIGAVAVFAGNVHGPLWVKVRSGKGPLPPPTPDPKPDPKPPGPEPKPSTDYIGAGGFAVLMSFDPKKTTRPPSELSVLNGKAVRGYLDSKCVDDPTSPGWKSYRIWPSNTTGGPKMWADAFAKKGGDDWILIGTGKDGYSGPLPKTEEEALSLLKKYGG